MSSILTIPSSDIYRIKGLSEQYFKYQHGGHIARDNYVDIPKNPRPVLVDIAKKMQIPGAHKLKKAELIAVITEHIRFE